MPDCEKYLENIEKISRLIDGDLSSEEEALLRAHMAQCGDCRKIYEAFTGVSSAICNETVSPPDTLAAGIMYKVKLQEQEKHKGKLRRFGWGRYTAIAAVFAVVILAASRSGFLGGAGKSVSGAADRQNSSIAELMEAPSEEDCCDNNDGSSVYSGSASLTSEDAPQEPESGAANEHFSRADGVLIWSSADISGRASCTVTDEETLEALYGSVISCGDLSACIPVPERECDFLLLVTGTDGETAEYSIWSENGRLWWCLPGSETAVLSPVTEDELLALLDCK